MHVDIPCKIIVFIKRHPFVCQLLYGAAWAADFGLGLGLDLGLSLALSVGWHKR